MPLFYKITLGVEGELAGEGKVAGVEGLFSDLVQAKDEFNTGQGHERFIFLLKPEARRIHLLFKMKQGQINADDPTPIQPFLDILLQDYGWGKGREQGEHCRDKLPVKVIKKIEPSTCEQILKKMKEKEPDFFDDSDAQILQKKKPRPSRKSMFEDLDLEGFQPQLTREEALEKLDKLVGLVEFKKEIQRIVAKEEAIKRLKAKTNIAHFFPQVYIFTYENEGYGENTVLEIMSSIFYHLGIVRSPGHKEIEPRDFFRLDLIGDEFGIFVVNEKRGSRGFFGDREIDGEVLERLDSIIVFSESRGSENANRIEYNLNRKGIYFRKIHFPDFSNGELLKIKEKMLAGSGISLEPEAEKEIELILEKEKSGGKFNNIRTVKKIIGMLFHSESLETSSKDNDNSFHFSREVCREVLKAYYPCEPVDKAGGSAWEQLQEMVGLQEVKRKLKEILTLFIMEKRRIEAGLKNENICMHMEFSGNPGTGKTTVARIIGQILKEEGILPEGKLIEVSRKDLIGAYVGHTALKTGNILEKARGNVLFIDEAYSLDGGTELDYGPEAIATLTKNMEDYRDQMVVILAGYPAEMERLMEVNPGLKERIPHRLSFPDYSEGEMISIMENLLGEDLQLTTGARDLLRDFFRKLRNNSGQDSGNGRLVRNVMERLRLKQSQRLFAQEEKSREAMTWILEEDVKELFNDGDFQSYLSCRSIREIGFRGT